MHLGVAVAHEKRLLHSRRLIGRWTGSDPALFAKQMGPQGSGFDSLFFLYALVAYGKQGAL
jgi:hypothetical protein